MPTHIAFIRINEIQQALTLIQRDLIQLRAVLASEGLEAPAEAPPRQRITGWRFVRGTHSGTYVEDPLGTDRLPPDYDLHDYHPKPPAEPGLEPLEYELPTATS